MAVATVAACGSQARRVVPTATSTAATVPNAGPVSSGTRYRIGFRTETFVDPTRPTAANGNVAGKPSRTLPTVIYYPVDGPVDADAAEGAPVSRRGPFPLVLLAHGINGFGSAYQTLLRAWSGHGYVVAAPTFPLTSLNAPGGSVIGDYVNQPADITFLITQLLAESQRPGTPLTGALDTHRIGVVGHSLGAITVLGLLDSCCRDPRVRAIVALAGAEGPFKNGTPFTGPPVPVLFEHGTADGTVHYDAGRTAYRDAQPPKYFVTLIGGDHSRPYMGSPSGQTTLVVTETTTDFLDSYLVGDPAATARLQQDATVAGVATIDASPEKGPPS